MMIGYWPAHGVEHWIFFAALVVLLCTRSAGFSGEWPIAVLVRAGLSAFDQLDRSGCWLSRKGRAATPGGEILRYAADGVAFRPALSEPAQPLR